MHINNCAAPTMPATSLPQFNPARIRSYILRLPFCTKVLVAAIVGLWIATIPFPWIRDFGRLEPAKMDLTQSMCFSLTYSEDGYGASVACAVIPTCGTLGSLGDGLQSKGLAEFIVGLILGYDGFLIIYDGNYANMSFLTVHRLNLFPVLHWNFLHMIFNLVAVTPLIERFESEYGTLVTLALFTGRKTCWRGLN